MSRRSLHILALFALLAGSLFLIYLATSLSAGQGEIVLPLDDVYIHFQYAKQLALGQPYVYNPGDPPTSGATSFLYPYLLAVGYLLGFQGLNLGLWAMLTGMLALVGSLYCVYALVRYFGGAEWLAVATTLIFGLSGAVNWHFFSGMETGLVICFTLATFYIFATRRYRAFVVSAMLLALIRPEASLLSLIAVGLWITEGWLRTRHAVSLRHMKAYFASPGRWLLLIPILAVFVQPIMNLLVTGTPVATGNSVKSVFGLVPFYWDVVLGRIVDNFVTMWAQFISGVSPREGLYIPYLIGPLAIAALLWSLWKGEQRRVGLLAILWLLAGTAAISTLDTAFWHFKRYQMPLMALLFPLAGWAIKNIQRKGAKTQREKINPLQYANYGLVAIGLLIAASTSAAFVDHFALNVGYVYAQPLQMARWLQANTSEDALVAVHDVGMMRYIGERHTLDMVGLTTAGAAAYWRNGPGSVAEFLIQERPDYIAAYGEGHGLGLGEIAQTSIYGEALATFPVDLDPNFNVALAADTQGIYEPLWESPVFDRVNLSLQDFNYGFNTWEGEPSPCLGCGILNVGNINQEKYNNYAWSNQQRISGFPTEIFELNYISCLLDNCERLDAGRRINGQESFSLKTGYYNSTAWDVVLVTRLQPLTRGTLDIYANGELMGTRWIPEIPGQWLELATLIPVDIALRNRESSNRIDIRIVPHMADRYYMPFYHWIDGISLDQTLPENVVATYQHEAFRLSNAVVDRHVNVQQLELHFDWYTDGSAEGDYRFFVHLYDDIDQPPIAQHDDYPGNGTLPPGNWLPGSFGDSVMIDTGDVPPGTYTLAIGFYDPYTGERLMPESEVYEVSPDGRLFLGEVEIPGEE